MFLFSGKQLKHYKNREHGLYKDHKHKNNLKNLNDHKHPINNFKNNKQNKKNNKMKTAEL